MKIINVTKNFRIVADTREYVVQQLHEIDPRNSPRFNPEKHDASIRYEWKDVGYYGLNESGLQSAIKNIIFKEGSLKGGEKATLREYLNDLREISDIVFTSVKKSIS